MIITLIMFFFNLLCSCIIWAFSRLGILLIMFSIHIVHVFNMFIETSVKHLNLLTTSSKAVHLCSMVVHSVAHLVHNLVIAGLSQVDSCNTQGHTVHTPVPHQAEFDTRASWLVNGKDCVSVASCPWPWSLYYWWLKGSKQTTNAFPCSTLRHGRFTFSQVAKVIITFNKVFQWNDWAWH